MVDNRCPCCNQKMNRNAIIHAIEYFEKDNDVMRKTDMKLMKIKYELKEK